MRSSLRKKAFCLRVLSEKTVIRGSQEPSHSMKIFVFRKTSEVVEEDKEICFGELTVLYKNVLIKTSVCVCVHTHACVCVCTQARELGLFVSGELCSLLWIIIVRDSFD